MSEKQIQVSDTFDFTKNIENISVSAAYIQGLEQVMMHIIALSEDASTIPPIFKKFEEYIANKLNLEENPFTEYESILYTIYSLHQLFKAHAYEQGLNVKVDATISQKLVEDVLAAVKDSDFEKVKELQTKMAEEINGQIQTKLS
tara:strand:- start:909 stop:1343 length:435 start_codon:yes stop_codon:yes gene_type:complete